VVACAGEVVALDGSRSVDLDGKVTRYHWAFGDGAEAEGAKVSHAFGKPGVYMVELAVSDDSGKSCGTATDTVRVRIDTPPLAVAGPDREAYVGGAHDEVLFDGTGSTDADNDPLTFRWDFGDGEKGTGPSVYHRYTKAGAYKVRLMVSDGTGAACGESSNEAGVVVKDRPGAEPVPTPAPVKRQPAKAASKKVKPN
jgi:PKD repeat protein